MFSSLAGIRLAGMRIGSGCQLTVAFSALAVEAGSEAVLELAWYDLLDLFAYGASVIFLSSAFFSCSGGLLMSCANMSVVRCAVVKGFATGCASKRTFGSLLSCAFR